MKTDPGTETEATESDWTDRFVSAAGFGFGFGLALCVAWLAFTVGHYIVQSECQFKQTGPIIWTPEN